MNETVPKYFLDFLVEFKQFREKLDRRLDAHAEAIAEIKVEITLIKEDIVNIKADIVSIKADIVNIKADIAEIRDELKNKVDKEDIKNLRLYVSDGGLYQPIFA